MTQTSQTELAISARAITCNLTPKSIINGNVNLATDGGEVRLTVPFELFPFLRENETAFLSLTLTVATVMPVETPAIITPKLIIPGRTN